MTSVDLNADVGEGAAADAELLALVTSANVACGFHAGDARTMRSVCAAAAAHGVSVGAHVSYRDRDGFGRRELGADAATVERDAREQIAALQAASGGRVAYVKPHGALYHRATVDDGAAAALVAAAAPLAVLGFPGSRLLARAREAGLLAVEEGFADRGYGAGGGLVPRGEPGAVLDAEAAVRQAVSLAGRVGSLCIHSDTPDAVELARRVRAALAAAGVELRAFA
ncbi:MAG TPA: LamB/YcsF family protein [Gaiellaceae bacterium]|nr:LamB/YcsF family protein [Gaiellaceae bacterium]